MEKLIGILPKVISQENKKSELKYSTVAGKYNF